MGLSEQAVHSNHQLGKLEGFCYVIVCPGLKCPYDARLVRLRRQHDNWHFLPGIASSKIGENLDAVGKGHHDIQQDQPRRLAVSHAFEGVSAVLDRFYNKAPLHEPMAEQTGNEIVIVDDPNWILPL